MPEPQVTPSTDAASLPVASVRGLVKTYPGVTALGGVDLALRAGEVRALLGGNGAGKSTLIKMLSGVETPDEGVVELGGHALGPDATVRDAKRLGVATVHQELSTVPDLSVAENLFLGVLPRGRLGLVDHRELQRRSHAALEALEIDVDPGATLGTLTLAQQQLVEIARCVQADPRLLILDEPTSSLAAAEVDVVLRAVRRVAGSGVAVVYVSHRLDEIVRVADAVTVLRDGQVVADEIPIAEVTTDRIVELMLGSQVLKAAETVVHDTHIDRTGIPLLRVRGLVAPPLVDGLDLDVFPGEVVGLAGLLGAGRTEALLAISGHLAVTEGTIEVDGQPVSRPTAQRMKKLGVGYTPEDRKRDGIVPLLGVDENLVASDHHPLKQGGLLSRSRIADAADALIAQLDIKVATRSTAIGTLSGGNQQKVVIGRWLHAGSRILLLDEPTRGVDVGSKAQIYTLVRELAATGAGVVFVSSELEELPLVCDRVEVVVAGRTETTLTGPEITTRALMTASMAVNPADLAPVTDVTPSDETTPPTSREKRTP